MAHLVSGAKYSVLFLVLAVTVFGFSSAIISRQTDTQPQPTKGTGHVPSLRRHIDHHVFAVAIEEALIRVTTPTYFLASSSCAPPLVMECWGLYIVPVFYMG